MKYPTNIEISDCSTLARFFPKMITSNGVGRATSDSSVPLQRSALMLLPETNSRLDHKPVSPLPTTTNMAYSEPLSISIHSASTAMMMGWNRTANRMNMSIICWRMVISATIRMVRQYRKEDSSDSCVRLPPGGRTRPPGLARGRPPVPRADLRSLPGCRAPPRPRARSG